MIRYTYLCCTASLAANETTDRCDDSCSMYADNGVCDDGGPGAVFAACLYGTDCTDCARSIIPSTVQYSVTAPQRIGDVGECAATEAPVETELECRQAATALGYGSFAFGSEIHRADISIPPQMCTIWLKKQGSTTIGAVVWNHGLPIRDGHARAFQKVGIHPEAILHRGQNLDGVLYGLYDSAGQFVERGGPLGNGSDGWSLVVACKTRPNLGQVVVGGFEDWIEDNGGMHGDATIVQLTSSTIVIEAAASAASRGTSTSLFAFTTPAAEAAAAISVRNLTTVAADGSERATVSPPSLGVSSARLPTCRAQTFVDATSGQASPICGPQALCVHATVANLTIPRCICPPDGYPFPSDVVLAELAPYRSDVGCLVRTQASSLRVRQDTDQLVVTLQKDQTTTERVTRDLTLSLRGTDPDSHQPLWHVTSALPMWLSVGGDQRARTIALPDAISNGRLVDVGWETAVPVSLACDGLAERSEAYRTTLLLTVDGQLARNVSTAMLLYVLAEPVALQTVWGVLAAGASHCSSATGVPLQVEIRAGAVETIPFQSCDLEGLPTAHALPSFEDARTFMASLTPVAIGGGARRALSQQGNSSSLLVQYLTGGVYEVLLTSVFLGEYDLTLRLGGESALARTSSNTQPIRVTVICPLGKLPVVSEDGVQTGTCGCAPGSQPDPNMGRCVACSQGSAKALIGNSPCRACAAGKYQDSTGQATCRPCAEGFFEPNMGATECSRCEARTNSTRGATSCDICAADFFREDAATVASRFTCLPCLLNAHCPVNTTLATIEIDEGYWRLSPASLKLYMCERGKDTNMTSCAGGTSPGQDGISYCAANHTGALCLACTKRSHYFAEADGSPPPRRRFIKWCPVFLLPRRLLHDGRPHPSERGLEWRSFFLLTPSSVGS